MGNFFNNRFFDGMNDGQRWAVILIGGVAVVGAVALGAGALATGGGVALRIGSVALTAGRLLA